MRRKGDSYDREAPRKKMAAKRAAGFIFTVFSVLVSFIALCLLAYLFRLISMEKDFRVEDFPKRVVHDLQRMNDPNVKLQTRIFFRDLEESIRGILSPSRPRQA